MKSRYNPEAIISLIAAILIALFVYTALSKLMQFHRFHIALRASPWLNPFSGQLVWAIPAVELILAVGLLIIRFRKRALLISGLLLLLFTVYIGAMLLFAKQLPCGCGGIIETLSWPQHLFVNVLLTVLAFTAWYLERKHKRTIAIASGYVSAGITGRSSRTPV
jgi:hypothetical protein